MNKILIAAIALAAVTAASTLAKADDFNDQQNSTNGVNAYMDRQATDAQLSDPTARNSLRSHGNH